MSNMHNILDKQRLADLARDPAEHQMAEDSRALAMDAEGYCGMQAPAAPVAQPVAPGLKQTFTRAEVIAAIEAERQACSIAVWMAMMDSQCDDAEDLGLVGWMREAEARIKRRSEADPEVMAAAPSAAPAQPVAPAGRVLGRHQAIVYDDTLHDGAPLYAAPQAVQAPANDESLVLRITTAYEQGFGHAHRAEISNPYGPPGSVECDAWDMGRAVGKRQAPSAAPAPAGQSDAAALWSQRLAETDSVAAAVMVGYHRGLQAANAQAQTPQPPADAQQAREALTDARISEIASTPCAVVGSYVHTFARAIEAACAAAWGVKLAGITAATAAKGEKA